MNCREVDELAPFFVAGALNRIDEAAVAAHIASCRNHGAMFSGLQAAIEQPSLVASTPAPSALKSRIMTAINRDDAVRRGGQPGRMSTGSPIAGLAARLAVAVLVIGLLAWNIELRTENSQQAAGTFSVALHSENGASGWMYYDDAKEAGVISVEGLASLPAGQTYQVWAVTSRGPQSCGLLVVSGNAPALARMTGEVASGQTIFVTVEPAGGSGRPSGATVLSSAR